MKSAGPKPWSQSLARAIRDLRRRYRSRLDNCQCKFSPAAVHALRIATRRLLALTELLEALGLGDSIRKLQRRLKHRLDAFDDLRDNQVQQDALATYLQAAPAATALKRRLRRRERKLIHRLQKDLQPLRPGRGERILKRIERDLVRLESGAAERLIPQVAKTLGRSFHRVLRLRQRARADRVSTIHRLRIAFKHHRYLCELLHPLWPPLAKVDLKAMHQLQTLLGEIQDCEVMLGGVRAAGAAAAIPRDQVRQLQASIRERRAQHIETALAKLERLRDFEPL